MINYFRQLLIVSAVMVLSSVLSLAQVTIGAANYTTLKGAFDAINAGSHIGVVTITVADNTTETATALLNASGVGAANYTAVNIYTTGNYTVSGNVPQALVRLQSAKNVTIDGRIGQTGNTNSLTFQNDAATSSAVIWMDSLANATSTGVKNIAIRYTNIVGGSATDNSAHGIVASAASGFGVGAPGFENIAILYNNFRRAYYGIRMVGGITEDTRATGILIRFNNFGNNATPTDGHYYGMDIRNAVAPTVRNNTFKVNTTTFHYSIYANTTPGGNFSDNIFTESSITGSFYGVYVLTSPNSIIANNNINSVTASSMFYGYYLSGADGHIFNNTVENSLATSSTFYGIFATASANTVIENNIIKNIINGSGSAYGIYVSSANGIIVDDNHIENMSTNITMHGIDLVTVTGGVVKNNLIGKLRSYSTGGYGVVGININFSCSSDTLFNNVIYDLTSTNYSTTSTAWNPFGIRITSGTGHAIWHNSVNLFGTQEGANSNGSLSACLIVTATAVTGIDVRNNVFRNFLVGLPGTRSFAVYLMGAANLTGSTIDNNVYHVGGPFGLTGYLGANFATLADWQTAATPHDMATLAVNPLFNSNTNLRPFTGSPVVGTGVQIPQVTTDKLGVVRATMAPTRGAYEETGDFAAPEIAFAPLGNVSTSGTTRLFEANIDDPSGVDTTNAPRVYYRKTTNANTYVDNTSATDGWKYSLGTGVAPNFTFSINHALLNGGFAVGDTIQYFVVAQDNNPIPHLGYHGADFTFAPFSVNLTAGDFPVSNMMYSYRFLGGISGIIDVGDGQTYTTLTDSTGLFRVINESVLTGSIIVRLVSDIFEPGHFGLNEVSSEGGLHSIIIRPHGAPRTITANRTGSILLINAADRVTIDGRLAGNSNDLTIINSSTGAANIIDIAGDGTNGANDITIRNVNIIGGDRNHFSSYGIIVRNNTGIVQNAFNHNISLLNNNIQNVYIGIRVMGGGTGLTGIIIDNNTIGSDVDTLYVGCKGITVENLFGPQITNNTVKNIKSARTVVGIEFFTGTTTNPYVVGNRISSIHGTTNSFITASGISLQGTMVRNAYIANNMISDIVTANYSNTSTANGFGIRATVGKEIYLYNNTIDMGGTIYNIGTTGSMTSAINVTSTAVDSVYVRGNLFVNTTAHNLPASRSLIYMVPINWFGIHYLDSNHYYVGGNYPSFARVGTNEFFTLAEWVAGVGLDSNSTFGPVAFESTTDATISGFSIGDPLLLKTTFANAPLTDIHGDPRDTYNYVGADIAIPTSLTIAQNLPSSMLRGLDPFTMEFLPYLGSTFTDGISRTIESGDILGIEYIWHHNNIPMGTVPGVDIERNVLNFHTPSTAHTGNYHATLSLMGLTAQTSICALLVDPLLPELIAPETFSMDNSINTQILWSAVTGATSYHLQISTQANFMALTVDTVITANAFFPTNLSYSTLYFWRVRGISGANQSSWTQPWNFTTRPAIYPVVLKTPMDNIDFIPVQPEFEWEENVDANSYRIQISTDATFATFHTNVVALDTVFTPTTTLAFMTTYFWRVQGLNPPYESQWSAVRSFLTRPEIYQPQLVYPSDMQINIPINANLTWGDAPGAITYRVQLATDVNFANMVVNQVVADTTHLVNDLFGETDYFWRVQGINPNTTSIWSNTNQFTTKKIFWGPISNDTITIGTGTLTTSYPFFTGWEDSRMQAIWTAAEIAAAGGLGGNITDLAFNIATFSAPQIMLGYTIKMQNTNLTTLSTFVNTGWTTVYFNPTTESVAGTNYWRFNQLQNPFTWDQVSNLLVEVCFDNSNWTSSTSVYATAQTANRVYHRFMDGGTGCSFTDAQGNLSSQLNRPNIKFAAFLLGYVGPELISPIDNATNQSLTATMTWEAMEDASSYNIQVATDAAFTNIIHTQTTSSTSANLANAAFITQYYWRVRGANIHEESVWSEVRSFTTRPAIFPTALFLPMNGAQFLPVNTTLSWYGNVDATSYRLQVSTNENFTTTHTDLILTDSSYTGLLPANVTLYWRVKGLSATHEGDWSAVWSFSTVPNIYPPNLLLPINGIDEHIPNPKFVWSSVHNAIAYTIELSEDLSFSNVLYTETTADTNFTIWGLDGGITYFWRVRAFSTTDISAWSDASQFTTLNLLSEVIIGNGTIGTYQYPMNRFFNNSAHEAIYLQSEIGSGIKTINKLAYNKVGGTDLNPILDVSIYLKHTTDDVLVTGLWDLAGYSMVYQGSYPNDSLVGWLEVQLDSVFTYNGVDNLQVLVLKGFQAYIGTLLSPSWAYTTVTPMRQRSNWSDGAMPTSLNANTNLPDIKFGFASSAIDAPLLSSPAHNATGIPTNHTLVWHSVPGATMYRVNMSNASGFDPIMMNVLTTDTTYSVSGLDFGIDYHWRIRAINDTSSSMWSSAWKFTSVYAPTFTPVLLAPANNSVDVPFSPTFQWDPSLYATNYQLEVSTVITFATTIFSGFSADTELSSLILAADTEYFWRVRALNPTNTSAWSSAWSFTTLPLLLPPTLVSPADSLVDQPVHTTLAWNAAPTATGYFVQVATNNSFANIVFADTVLTETVVTSMLAASTEHFWRVRSLRNGEVSTWSVVRSFTTGTGMITQTIPLTSGWNMFSANVAPQNTAMSNILTPLLGNMMLIKNVYGQVFAPPFQASLTNWNTSHAYQARMTTPANLVLQGIPIVPEMTPITLDYLGWYWLPYYRTSSMPVGNALATIQGKYLQIKSITGQVHQPPFITTLQNLEPNMGYMIRMSATDGTLTYPSNAIIKAGSDPVHIPQPKVFVRDAAVTGKTAVIALELDNMQDGDEVGVFTRDGLLVGSSVWANGSRGVVVWGDDEYTNEKDGATEGEDLIVKIWSSQTKNIGNVAQIALNDMTDNSRQFTLTYETDAVYLLKGTAEETESSLFVSPQPASSEVYVRMNFGSESPVSVKLYNQAGQLGLELNETVSNGVLKINTSMLPSGVYQLILTTDGKVYTDKVIIVK